MRRRHPDRAGRFAGHPAAQREHELAEAVRVQRHLALLLADVQPPAGDEAAHAPLVEIGQDVVQWTRGEGR